MNARRCEVLVATWLAIVAAPGFAQNTKEARPNEEVVPEPEEAPKDDPNKIAAELARLRLDLQRLTIDEERLLELRIRHGLGLGTESAAPFLVQDGDRAATGPGSERTLKEEEGQLTELSRRFDEMQRKVAADKARHPAPGDPEIPRHPEREVVKKPVAGRTGEANPTAKARPEPRTVELPGSRPQDSKRVRPEPAPKLLVAGSTDRSTVGRVLFHAGRYKEAREELLEAVKHEPPDLQDHFLLGLCHERLGEPAKADDLFKKVEALDTRETPQGKVAGPWAEAARAASRQMSWMGDHGQWKLPRAIDSIEWRKGRR